jgi:hypothetical protein
MNAHDPRRVIEDIRDHLAAHDRHLAFLFGAGTSSAVNTAPAPSPGAKQAHVPLIPGIEGLTATCNAAVCKLGKIQTAAWEVLSKQCKKDSCAANIENVLSRVRMKIDAIGDGESLLGLDRKGLSEIESTICVAIAKTVNPSPNKFPSKMPQDQFAAWVRKVSRSAPMEVFTTNYDLLFERAFEAARVPVFDGFVGTHHPFFYAECLEDETLLPNPKWIRLWKLHGSVNWFVEDGSAGKRIARGQPTASGELILPSNRKYDESRKQPYLAYMDRLSRIINSDHSLLITCGYSFGDEHINAILYGALDNRRTANVIALQFQNLEENSPLVEAAIRRSNLSVIGPNAGVITGEWAPWQLTQPVDNKTSSFMDIGFDSNALPEDEGSAAVDSADLKGRMRLGDFMWFCRFRNAMGPDAS